MSLAASSASDSARVIELLEKVVALLEGRGVAAAQPLTAPADQMVNLKQLAELIHRRERTVRRMRAAGELPEPTVPGQHPRWKRSVVDAWIAQRGSP